MQLKRVRITAREVHDGLGGVHYKDQTPTLPAEITEIFVARNMAVYEEDTRSPEEIRKAAEDEKDRVRQAEQKGRATSAMKLHDLAPPEVRIEEAFPDPEDRPPEVAEVINRKKRERRK